MDAPAISVTSLCQFLVSGQYVDDHEMFARGMVMYDALYRCCKEGRQETRTWNPEAYR